MPCVPLQVLLLNVVKRLYFKLFSHYASAPNLSHNSLANINPRSFLIIHYHHHHQQQNLQQYRCLLRRRIWLATSVLSLSRLAEGDHVARPGGQAASEGGRRWTNSCRVVPQEVEAVPSERLQMHGTHRPKFTDEGSHSAQFLDARLVRTVAMTIYITHRFWLATRASYGFHIR